MDILPIKTLVVIYMDIVSTSVLKIGKFQIKNNLLDR